ncbi:MAG: hypothetical protein QG652_109, partial [Pseudomonadota bacterium]|nr:hypothetical protein [Pseudomonadota bacterium]
MHALLIGKRLKGLDDGHSLIFHPERALDEALRHDMHIHKNMRHRELYKLLHLRKPDGNKIRLHTIAGNRKSDLINEAILKESNV